MLLIPESRKQENMKANVKTDNIKKVSSEFTLVPYIFLVYKIIVCGGGEWMRYAMVVLHLFPSISLLAQYREL